MMRRRWSAVLTAGALVFATFASAGGADADDGGGSLDVSGLSDGEVIPGRYVVIMEAEPLVAQFGQDGLGTPAAERAANGLKKGHAKALAAVGAAESQVTADYTVALNGFAAQLSDQQVAKLRSVEGVATVIPDVWRTAQTDNSGDFLGLNEPGGFRSEGFAGEGVVVGIIDTGIWPEHPSFADDGSFSDLGIELDEADYPACDFGNTTHNSNDAAFDCNDKLIGARQMLPTYRALVGAEPEEFDSARDDDGHGTHTASTTAGNAGVEASILGVDRGVVTGVAPRARVIAYKGLGALGGVGSDLAAAIDQAVADGVDVINYSIGSSSFAIGPDDIAFLFAADAGVFVATSNGNSGPGPATTGSPASVPWLTSVGASTQDRTFQGSASSPDGWEFFGASVTPGTGVLSLVDAEDAGGEGANLCLPGTLDPNVVGGKIVLCERGANARVEKGLTVHLAGGAGMILFNQFDAQEQVTDTHFLPAVHINNTDGLAIKAYIDGAGAGAMAQINAGELTPSQGSVMAAFSSRGPNGLSSDIIKPDVTAPGVNILAGNTPFPLPGAVSGELFQSISGTSMSSPHVAGLFTLIKQARPDWTPAMAKSALMTTSRQDVVKEDAVTAADPFDMGAGHVDPSGPVSAKNSMLNPGVVYDAGFFEYVAFTCGAELGIATPGLCVALADAGYPMDPSDLNLPSIGIGELAGAQTVTRTVTNVSGEDLALKLNVDAPKGYRVDVTPTKLDVPAGGEASYQVTISNHRAPLGEWAFGSITLTEGGSGNGEGRGSGQGNGRGQGVGSGGYEVYSPIAVRSVQVGVPDLVEGTGVDGSISFEVDFGYTGDYSATAHGLVPATVVTDVVEQDPDQEFDPDDGWSEAITVETSGAALLRFEMPPEAVTDPAVVDIDLFLFDPDGNEAAVSTNGGTDELIEVLMPADGTWTLYVHGWQTGGGPAPFDLYSWVVSATPGGNMTVDDAPTSASLATTGTVNLSWEGAADEAWHLGLVSHADADGQIGLTRVEVDNR